MTKLKEPVATHRATKDSKGQRVGYVRISTAEQHEQRQLEGVDLHRTFLDKASGKDVERPQLEAMGSRRCLRPARRSSASESRRAR